MGDIVLKDKWGLTGDIVLKDKWGLTIY